MSKDVILRLKKFTISYEPTYHRGRTARDFFVELVKNPLDYFFKQKEQMVVLRDIDLEIRKGEVVGILGTNGVGKTSLCRYLSGIIKNKNVEIFGESRAIFESNAVLYPDLTGRENAAVLMEFLYTDLGAEEKEALIEESIDFSELKEFIDTPFKNYSRGMKSRLYLSLLTSRPVDLLVIDEAFGGTDQFFTEKLEKRLHHLISLCGAVVIVSHNMDEIRKCCNRVIVLKSKGIAYDGATPAGVDFYNQQGAS